MRDRKGLTLLELLIVLVIGGIMATAMVCQFVALITISRSLQDELYVREEAYMAMRHMMNMLRFHNNSVSALCAIDSMTLSVEGGHLTFIKDDTQVAYKRYGTDNTLRVKIGGNPEYVVARGVTFFNSFQSWTGYEIAVVTKKGKRTFYLQTYVQPHLWR